MSKVEAIKKAFGKVIGATLTGYSTAEIFVDGWEPWNDLPIRLAFKDGQKISVAWSKLDELWLSNDQSLPFNIYESKVRWIENTFDDLNRLIGGVIISVSLGQDYLALGGQKIPLNIHLVVETDQGVMDIFNALDENGYAYFSTRPLNLKLCVP